VIDSPETRTIAALYRPLASGAWHLERVSQVLSRGYWSPVTLSDIIALRRRGDV
jgi:hypothetical protein